ncbi:MAG: LysR family transcriptional regulator, partial [Eubacteriaceae bacterium]|nr:LysR family transcriptional regulator [Eubacteriaceae bacterium]
MELLQLKYFLELCETQHVSKTAEKLNISQPSLSSTIKKLEKELGAPLFVRKGRNLELSEYGQVYKDYIQQAFFAMENGRRQIKLMRDEDEKSINLGILSPYVWNDTFRSFRERYPEIKINQFSIEGFKFLSAIIDGRID